MVSPLLSLPPEILSHILCRLSHTDLLSFSITSHEARTFTSPRNQLLWQAIFLQKFDDPRDRWNSLEKSSRYTVQQREVAWDWFNELRRRIVALRYVKSGNLVIEEGDGTTAETVIASLLDIIDTAKVCPTIEDIKRGRKAEVDDRELSLNLALLPINYNFTPEFDGLVRGLPASVIRRNMGTSYYGGDILAATSMPGAWDSGRPAGRPMTRLQAAMELDKVVRSEHGSRLHVLCGLTEYEEHDEKGLGRARRVVYDWDATGASNEYGPCKRDGSGEVDWRRLEAVCTVVARQFGLAVRGRMILPQGFCFSLPYRTLSDPTVPDDWARCQGTWCGTYV